MSVASEDMAEVLPGGLVPGHVGEVSAVVTTDAPDPDGVDRLGVQELKSRVEIQLACRDIVKLSPQGWLLDPSDSHQLYLKGTSKK